MPSRKVSMRSSLTNKTSIFGIMGGLYNRKISGRSSMNRVTSRLEIPASAKEGYQYMKLHNLLSRNPLGSGGVGKMFRLRAGGSSLGSRRTSSENSENNLGDDATTRALGNILYPGDKCGSWKCGDLDPTLNKCDIGYCPKPLNPGEMCQIPDNTTTSYCPDPNWFYCAIDFHSFDCNETATNQRCTQDIDCSGSMKCFNMGAWDSSSNNVSCSIDEPPVGWVYNPQHETCSYDKGIVAGGEGSNCSTCASNHSNVSCKGKPSSQPLTSSPDVFDGTYTVQSGDTCSSIASNLCTGGNDPSTMYFCPSVGCEDIQLGETIKYNCATLDGGGSQNAWCRYRNIS